MSRVAQYALFLSIVILLVAGIHLYLWLRLVRDTAMPGPFRTTAVVSLAVLAVSLPLVFLLGRLLPLKLSRIVLFPAYLWMGMIVLLVFFLAAADLLRLLAWVGLKLSGHVRLLADPDRRLLLSRTVAATGLAVTLGLTVIAVPTAFLAPVVRRVRVELDRLPSGLDGFKVAQLTDLHLGPTLGAEFLRDVVERTNALSPDLVAITGDLVDLSIEKLRPAVQSLADLRAPHGVYFVTGNHEFYAGVDDWLPEIERLGVKVLNNQWLPVDRGGEGFDLAGVHDLEARRISPPHRPDLSEALAGRDQSRVLVLLAHQARMVDEAARLGVGLQLSGHNHGGQIWPWTYFVYLQQPYVRGLHRHRGTRIYVSEGTGFWGPPMRLGTRSEITLIELTSSR